MYKAQKEVGELKEILPDIKAKIEDSEDERKNMDQLKNLAKEALVGIICVRWIQVSLLDDSRHQPHYKKSLC